MSDEFERRDEASEIGRRDSSKEGKKRSSPIQHDVQALDEIEEDLVADMLDSWSSPRYRTRERLMDGRRSKAGIDEEGERRRSASSELNGGRERELIRRTLRLQQLRAPC